MGATHALRRTRWPVYMDHARGKDSHSLVFLCLAGTRGYTVSIQDVLISTASVLPTLGDYSPIHDTPDFLVQSLSVPRFSLGLLSTWLSLRTLHITLAFLARCLFIYGSSLCTAVHLAVILTSHTHCYFMMQARAFAFPNFVTTTPLHHYWLPISLPSWCIRL